MSNSIKLFYEFGSYRLDVTNRLLLHNGAPLPLTPKAVDTLIVLIQHKGEVLRKDDLMKLVWPDSTVEEGNLTQNIYLLRKTLKHLTSGQNHIETLSRRGYRFVGDVRELRTDKGGSRLAMTTRAEDEHAGNDSPDDLANQEPQSALSAEFDEVNKYAVNSSLLLPSPASSFGFNLRPPFLIAAAVVFTIAVLFLLKLPGRGRVVEGHASESAEAYQAYVKGRNFWSRQTTPALEQAVQYFQQAVRHDTSYASAYAGLADSYISLSARYDMSQHHGDALAKAKEAAARAVQLNDRLAEGHVALAVVKQRDDWDWRGAESEFKRAIQLNPNYAYAHQEYAFLLATLGRHDEAKVEIARAQELDPKSLSINQDAGEILWFAGDHQKAIDQYRRTLEMDPSDSMAITLRHSLGWAYEEFGMPEQAAAEFIESLRLQNGSPERVSALRQAYDAAGMKGYWRKWLEFRQERIRLGGVNPFYVAQVYAVLGEKDEAFAFLIKACDDRSLSFATLRFGPTFDELRSDPRYRDILRRAGFGG